MSLEQWKWGSYTDLPFYLIILFPLFTILLKKALKGNAEKTRLGKQVPWVSGCLPIVGHGLYFYFDAVGFLQRAQEKHGSIFKVKIFSKTVIILCDRQYAAEFFAAKEDKMSLYRMFEQLYVDASFSCEKLPFLSLVEIFRGAIAIDGSNTELVLPKIEMEAKLLVERLRKRQGKPLDLREEITHFIANTSSRIFLGVPMTQKSFQLQFRFNQLVNKIVMFTFLFPRRVLKWFLNRKLVHMREQIAETFLPEIKKYRDDPSLDDSYIIRKAVDFVNDKGETLSDKEIGAVIVSILFLSIDNAAQLLLHVLADLANHPDAWNKARNEVKRSVQDKGYHDKLKYTQACIMESARIHSLAFNILREPNPTACLKGYYVGDADVIAMCEVLLHFQGEAAGKVFSNPEDYNPERFLELGESYGPTTLMTFGAGIHRCVGKALGLLETKVGLAHVLVNLRNEFNQTKVPKHGYFSPSGLAGSEMRVVLTALKGNEKDEEEVICSK